MIEEKDPQGRGAKTSGSKLDAGKAPIMRGLLHYFPRACIKVSELSATGAEKYSWNGWENVPDGIERYGDALCRHIVQEAIEGPLDVAWLLRDKAVLHATADAWNALARLELILRAEETEKVEAAQGDRGVGVGHSRGVDPGVSIVPRWPESSLTPGNALGD